MNGCIIKGLPSLYQLLKWPLVLHVPHAMIIVSEFRNSFFEHSEETGLSKIVRYPRLDLIYATDMLAELRGFQGQRIEQMPNYIPQIHWLVSPPPPQLSAQLLRVCLSGCAKGELNDLKGRPDMEKDWLISWLSVILIASLKLLLTDLNILGVHNTYCPVHWLKSKARVLSGATVR